MKCARLLLLYAGVCESARVRLHISRSSGVRVGSSECFVMMGLLLMLLRLRLMAWLMLSLVGGGFHVVGRRFACFHGASTMLDIKGAG